MARSVLLIANPNVALVKDRRQWAELGQALKAKSVQADTVLTEAPGHARELSRQNCEKYDVLAAVGGDGMLNEVATGILESKGAKPLLATVPAGTGNDVAAQLGIRGAAEAAGALVRGVPRWIDVIKVQYQCAGEPRTRYALSFAAAGFAGRLVKVTTPGIKRLFCQRFCYAVGFLRALFSFRAPWMRVSADGESMEGPMFHVCAGNAEWAGGGVMRISPGAKMDDGQMEICLIPALGRAEILWRFPSLLRGTHIHHAKTRYFGGARLQVEAEPPADVQLDGDPVGTTPTTWELRPRALSVLSLVAETDAERARRDRKSVV